jgi:tRNA(Ile)-lysidine synthase
MISMHPSDCDLLPQVQAYIEKHGLFCPGSCLVLGISGGPDSVALLDLMHRLSIPWNLTLHLAHLNHQLRPSAQADAQLVQMLSTQYHVPIHLGLSDVAMKAKTEKRSIEDAARQARREFFATIKNQVGASAIVLGHTRSDQAETVLFRLMRGSGGTGLGGIRPKTPQGWVRPLLFVSRSQIEAYVHMRQLAVCHDESNLDNRYTRNRIRHDLLPHIKRNYSPQIETILSRTADLLQTDHDFLEEQAQNAFFDVVQYRAKRKIILDVKRFFGYHVALRRRLIRMALFELYDHPDAAAYEPVSRILQAVEQNDSRTHIIDDLSAHRIGDFCFLTRPTPPFCIPVCHSGTTGVPDLNAHMSARITSVELAATPQSLTDNCTAIFDLDHLPDRLYLRPPSPGDRMCPFGLQGRRKISTLLIDKKIPHPLRDELPLLVGSDNTVLWAIGLRRASIAPVTQSTRRVLELVFQGGWQHLFVHPEKRVS